MKNIAITIFCLHLLAGCATSYNEANCIFSKNKIICEEYSECEKIIQNQHNVERRGSRILNLISKEGFSILLNSIEAGHDCAISLGFRIFELALKNSEAGYLEELSISLSYSIEKNPIKFLQYLPGNFTEHNEIIISLCCGVSPEFRENIEYIKIHLNSRLKGINSAKQADLNTKRNIVGSSIANSLKEYVENSEN